MEAEELNTRLQIAEMLQKGITYREIIKRTNVGAATVARIAKRLHQTEVQPGETDAALKTIIPKINLNQYTFGLSQENSD